MILLFPWSSFKREEKGFHELCFVKYEVLVELQIKHIVTEWLTMTEEGLPVISSPRLTLGQSTESKTNYYGLNRNLSPVYFEYTLYKCKWCYTWDEKYPEYPAFLQACLAAISILIQGRVFSGFDKIAIYCSWSTLSTKVTI